MEDVTVVKVKNKPKLVVDNTETKLKPPEQIVWIGVKVKTIRFHQPTNIRFAYKGSLDSKIDNVDMTLLPVGVLCKWNQGQNNEVIRIIANNNLFEVDLFE